MIEFHKTVKVDMVEVSELLPLNYPANTFIYPRSSEAGEILPAGYEKALAKWMTKDTVDKADILKPAYGDPVGAAPVYVPICHQFVTCSGLG